MLRSLLIEETIMSNKIFIFLILILGLAFAQDDFGVEIKLEDSPYLVVGEVGLGGGFPGYQLYHTYFSFQKEKLGMAFKGSWTSAGPYLQASVRYYTPIPVPVPTFVSLGAGVFGKTNVLMATMGTHIPLGITSPVRVTIEAGGAYMNILGKDQFLPTLSLGLGYTFFIDAEPISKDELARQDAEKIAERSGCTNPTEPDSSLVGRAISNIIASELDQARAAYAGVYELISYNEKLKETVNGDKAHISGTFTAKVKEVLSGNIIDAKGSVEADLFWTGCSWALSDYKIF